MKLFMEILDAETTFLLELRLEREEGRQEVSTPLTVFQGPTTTMGLSNVDIAHRGHS
jgi:hypothetical protein